MNTRVGQEQQNDGSGGRSSMNSALSCMFSEFSTVLKKNQWMDECDNERMQAS